MKFPTNYLDNLINNIEKNRVKKFETVAKILGRKYEFITRKDGSIKVYYNVRCFVYGTPSSRTQTKIFQGEDKYDQLKKFMVYRLNYEARKCETLTYKLNPSSFVQGKYMV